MLRVASLLAIVALALGQDVDVGSGAALVINPSGKVTLMVGETFSARCSVTDDSAKDEGIEFTKDGNQIEATQVAAGIAVTTVDSVTVADSGVYMCTVLLPSGQNSASVTLMVMQPGAPPAPVEHKKSFDRFAYQRICKPGCKGVPGDHGPHGDDGLQGPAGAPGPAGPPGTTLRRPVKIQILKGDDGPQGRPGPAGSPGMHGMHGMPGFPGPSGAEGAKGGVGQPGYPGQQGPPGPVGDQGEIGERGFAGRTGPTGPNGGRGSKGDRGPVGAAGAVGESGADGAAGRDGLRGEPGDQGPSGAQGSTGNRGDTGDKGQLGAQGLTGATGETGFKGATGRQGVQGETGLTGIKGTEGATGDKGDIGPEVYIHRRVEKECNQATTGEVAYGPDMSALYFCNGNTWECVESGGCKECDDYVTTWSAWSACSVTCGDGFQMRTRSYRQRPDFALQDCKLQENQPCFTGVSCMSCVESGTTFQLGETRFFTAPADVAADVLLVVDESSSMETEHAWLPGMVELLEAKLIGTGIGSGTKPNLYSLTSYGAGSSAPDACAQAKFPSSMNRLFPSSEYSNANSHLSTAKNGEREDGWQALMFSMQTTKYRNSPGIARNLVLVTDEDRDNDCDNTLNKDSVSNEILSRGFKLNSVLNIQYAISANNQNRGNALGVYGNVAGDRTALIHNNAGGYGVVNGASMNLSSTQPSYNLYTIPQYVHWTLDQEGAVWDLGTLRQIGPVQDSFTAAFVDIKTAEIAEQARACSICTCRLVNGQAQSMCVPASNSDECQCRATNGRYVNGECIF